MEAAVMVQVTEVVEAAVEKVATAARATEAAAARAQVKGEGEAAAAVAVAERPRHWRLRARESARRGPTLEGRA